MAYRSATLTVVAAVALAGAGFAPSPHRGTHLTGRPNAAYTVLYSFKGANKSDGAEPYAPLIEDKNGGLYGTTTRGGTFGCHPQRQGCGTVFKLTPSGSTYVESVLYSFKGYSDGSYPYGGLDADSTGALYGTTQEGGNGNHGTAFKLTPSGSTYVKTTIYAFKNRAGDGSQPWARLIHDPAGNLYGTTYYGGIASCYCGTVFKLTPKGSTYVESVLYQFAGGNDGQNPAARLLIDKSGALYGTTVLGGGTNACTYGFINSCGTVFKLTPSGSTYTESILYRFQGIADGGLPYGGLVSGPNGTLYGTTEYGGFACYYSGCGVVFVLTPSGSTYQESVLYRFPAYGDGANPTAGIYLDPSGAIYGTTTKYGAPACLCGTAYQLTLAGSTYSETVLHQFAGGASDGATPYAALIHGKSGAFFGTTFSGGTTSNGTVFALTP